MNCMNGRNDCQEKQQDTASGCRRNMVNGFGCRNMNAGAGAGTGGSGCGCRDANMDRSARGNSCSRCNTNMERSAMENSCGCRNMNMERNAMENGCNCRSQNMDKDKTGQRSCGASSDPIMGMPVGMGYVPMQQWGCVYSVDEGLSRGTIFPDLELPFLGCVPRGCAMGERR